MANRTILYQILVLISLISCGKSNDSQQAAERKAYSIKYRAEIRRIGNSERGDLKKQTLIKLIPILKEKKLDYHLFLAYANRNTAKMNQKVNEIVWSLNTRNDTVGSLVSYITNFAKNFFEGSSIRLSIIKKEEVAQLENNFFPSDKRRSLYLVAKEIINNAAKHSDAERVLLEFYVEQDKLCIKITDDGKGIDDAEQSKGNGLKNITDRMTYVGAEYSCLTGAFGTSYTLKTKIAKR